MTPAEHHQHVKAIFAKVAGVPAAERPQLVRDACNGDSAVRQEVESLLRSAEGDDDFLRMPPVIDQVASEATLSAGRAGTVGASPMIGRTIGAYTIQAVIAEGGMGMVYRALQRHPERAVALKVIRPGLVSRAALKRFEHESRVLAMLSHPCIAQVYEAGTSEDGLPFFAMELVEGALPLTEFARNAGLDLPAKLALLAHVCDAVQHGHQKGVIHRDLKPANILVQCAPASEPRPKVIDFGVARIADSSSPAATMETSAGQIIGTLAYMSPEQCDGDPHAIDVRSDVYALGVIAFELLTGKLPYDISGTSIATAARTVRETPPARPAMITPELRGDPETVLLKALEKEPPLRYQSASELAMDLRRLIAHQPISARPQTTTYLIRKFLRRHPLRAAGAAAFVLLLAGASVVSTLLYLSASRAKEAESSERARADERSAQLSRRVYAQQLGLAHAAVAGHDAGRALALLNACDPAMRGWEWRHLRYLADRSAATLKVPGSSAGIGAIIGANGESGAGTALFCVDGAGNLARWAIEGGAWGPATLVHAHEGAGTGLALSPDEGMIAASSQEGEVKLWDARTLALIGELPRNSTAVWSVAFSPDGTLLAASDSNRQIRLFDVRSRALVRTLAVHTTAMLSVVFVPGRGGVGGDEIWCSALDGTVRGFETATGAPIATIRAHELSAWSLCASPDGTLLACAGDDGALKIIDVAARTIIGELRVGPDGLRSARFSADGRRLVTAGRDGAVRVWSTLDWKEEWSICAHAGASAVTLLADGTILSGGDDGLIKVWDASLGPAVPTLSRHADGITLAEYSHDGRRLLTTVQGDTLASRDPLTGEPLTILRGSGRYQACAAWSPDGIRVVTGDLSGTVTAIDARSGVPITSQPALGSAITAICFQNASLCYAASAAGDLVADDELGQRTVLLSPPSSGPMGKPTRGGIRALACAGPGGTGTAPPLAVAADELVLLQNGFTKVASVAAVSGALAFSRAGDVLASGEGNAVVLRNAQTLAEIRRLTGHLAAVSTLAFTPDGSRVVSGSGDRTVRIWDTRTGEELLVLNGRERASHVRFSPAGDTLAVGWADGRVEVFESRSDAAVHANRRAVADAGPVVSALFDRLGVSEDVIAALRGGAATGLNPPARAAALRIAAALGDSATDLNTAAWSVASNPAGTAEQYRLALRRAEVAVRLTPGNGMILNTLGVARYRAGEFEEALTTLRESEQINTARSGRTFPADVLFIAMSLHKLGRNEEATAALSRGEALMAGPQAGADPESVAFLREARALMADMPKTDTHR